MRRTEVSAAGRLLLPNSVEAGEKRGTATLAESVKGRTGASGREGTRAPYWIQRQVRVTHGDPPPRRLASRRPWGESSRTPDRRHEPDALASPSSTTPMVHGDQCPYRESGQRWPFLPRPPGSLPRRAGYDRSPARRLWPWKRHRHRLCPGPIATRTNTRREKGEVQ